MKKITFLRSKAVIALIFILLSSICIIRYKPNLTSWDTFGYYLYLPATFIWNDPGLKDTAPALEAMEKYSLSATFYQIVPHENGNNIIKYTPGLAVLFAPGFIVAHLTAIAGLSEADGFSWPYQLAVFITTLFFIFIGLVYSMKILRFLFREPAAIYTVIFLVAGTNLFYIFTFLTTIHLYLFAIYTFLIWQTIRWHEDPTKNKAALIGLSVGLITLIRPTDAISIMIPLFWGIFDLPSFKKKFILIITHPWNMVMVVIFGLIPVSLLLLYWKSTTGQLLFYSYANPGEGLDFFTPYISQVLFSFRKGWFIYTPMMLLAFWGFYFLWKHLRVAFAPVLLFTIFNIYLVSSWTCWWYAGSFGQRAMVQSYAILLLPLGALVYDLLLRKRLLTYITLAIAFCFVFLNLFQTWQYKNKIIDGSRMTKPYYWAVFGQTAPVDDDTKELLLVERSLTAEDVFANKDRYYLKRTMTVQYSEAFGVPADKLTTIDSSTQSYVQMDSNYVFTPAFRKNFEDMTDADHLYLIITAQVYLFHDPVDNPFSLVATFEHKGGAYKYRALDSEKIQSQLKVNEWNTIEMLYLTPEIRNSRDCFATYYWLRGKLPILVGDIQIELWEPERGW